MNKLYFGDSLDILKKLHHEHPSGFIELIYIDPPFNSKRNYNILFEEADLKDTKAQKEAFADTWSNVSYKDTIEELKDIDLDLFLFLESLDKIRISKSAVSYLTTMAIRIHYMHKVLKNTGSFYLHCDPTMSHYLKIICDLIFQEKHFRNEIIWKRASTVKGNFGQGSKFFGPNTDTVLFYTKSNKYTFNQQFTAYSDAYLKKFYKFIEPETGRRYRLISMIGPGGESKGNPKYEVMGITRYWRYSQETMQQLINDGLVIQTKPNNVPVKKLYLDEGKGVAIQSLWDDIDALSPSSRELLGYPTQKPEALLQRIIETSTNKGDLVADFFCGCGTTISVAQKMKRKWLGVDISHLAIGLIERRLIMSYGKEIKNTYETDGLPKDLSSAKRLAEGVSHGRIKFQEWIIEAMLGGIHNPKKTADGGWDGHLTFELPNQKKDIILVEVKSGNVNVKNLREFIQVVNKQKASIGIFVCFEDQVTKPMLLEAKDAGYYKKEMFGNNYDKIQILTVEKLLDGEQIKMPNTLMTTFKSAEKKEEEINQAKIF
jgi:DNA modification methylase